MLNFHRLNFDLEAARRGVLVARGGSMAGLARAGAAPGTTVVAWHRVGLVGAALALATLFTLAPSTLSVASAFAKASDGCAVEDEGSAIRAIGIIGPDEEKNTFGFVCPPKAGHPWPEYDELFSGLEEIGTKTGDLEKNTFAYALRK